MAAATRKLAVFHRMAHRVERGAHPSTNFLPNISERGAHPSTNTSSCPNENPTAPDSFANKYPRHGSLGKEYGGETVVRPEKLGNVWGHLPYYTPLRQWSAKRVGAWLGEIGDAYEQYAAVFVANGIDGETLLGINEADLKELGVATPLHQRRILLAIDRSRGVGTTVVRSAAMRLVEGKVEEEGEGGGEEEEEGRYDTFNSDNTQEDFNNVRSQALASEQTCPQERIAVYTHTDGTSEEVHVVKEHPEGEGGGFTVYIPSLQRERQTVAERLQFDFSVLMEGFTRSRSSDIQSRSFAPGDGGLLFDPSSVLFTPAVTRTRTDPKSSEKRGSNRAQFASNPESHSRRLSSDLTASRKWKRRATHKNKDEDGEDDDEKLLASQELFDTRLRWILQVAITNAGSHLLFPSKTTLRAKPKRNDASRCKWCRVTKPMRIKIKTQRRQVALIVLIMLGFVAVIVRGICVQLHDDGDFKLPQNCFPIIWDRLVVNGENSGALLVSSLVSIFVLGCMMMWMLNDVRSILCVHCIMYTVLKVRRLYPLSRCECE
jgi:hypothetical protein